MFFRRVLNVLLLIEIWVLLYLIANEGAQKINSRDESLAILRVILGVSWLIIFIVGGVNSNKIVRKIYNLFGRDKFYEIYILCLMLLFPVFFFLIFSLVFYNFFLGLLLLVFLWSLTKEILKRY
tara:strand:- start:45 stop:416 length:372 start_codon:yes stop_codon:yes gene_type:complete